MPLPLLPSGCLSVLTAPRPRCPEAKPAGKPSPECMLFVLVLVGLSSDHSKPASSLATSAAQFFLQRVDCCLKLQLAPCFSQFHSRTAAIIILVRYWEVLRSGLDAG